MHMYAYVRISNFLYACVFDNVDVNQHISCQVSLWFVKSTNLWKKIFSISGVWWRVEWCLDGGTYNRRPNEFQKTFVLNWAFLRFIDLNGVKFRFSSLIPSVQCLARFYVHLWNWNLLKTRHVKSMWRHRWTNLKKIQTDCNCGFWKLVSLIVFQSSFLLFVAFDIAFSQTFYILFKVRRAYEIKYKPRGIYWPPAQVAEEKNNGKKNKTTSVYRLRLIKYLGDTFLRRKAVILSFTSNFSANVKFHSE